MRSQQHKDNMLVSVIDIPPKVTLSSTSSEPKEG